MRKIIHNYSEDFISIEKEYNEFRLKLVKSAMKYIETVLKDFRNHKIVFSETNDEELALLDSLYSVATSVVLVDGIVCVTTKYTNEPISIEHYSDVAKINIAHAIKGHIDELKRNHSIDIKPMAVDSI